jgi:hypothetical protein
MVEWIGSERYGQTEQGMSGPRFPRETFAPLEPDFVPGDGPNGAQPSANGVPADNVDHTRPHGSFGSGSGPAGAEVGPPPFQMAAERPPPPDDGFGEPTLAGGAIEPVGGGPAGNAPGAVFGPIDSSSFGEHGFAAPMPPAGPAPSSFAEVPRGLGSPPTLGDRPASYDRPVPGPGEYGEPTVGASGVPGQPSFGAPGVGRPPPATARSRPQQRPRGPRRAKLQLRHINPWTVLKFSCVLSVALFFVWLITIGLLYGILQAAGVIDHINSAATTINGNGSTDPVTPGLVFGGSAIIGVINVILFIALSTVGSVVYNLCADLVGGIEVTLSERD